MIKHIHIENDLWIPCSLTFLHKVVIVNSCTCTKNEINNEHLQLFTISIQFYARLLFLVRNLKLQSFCPSYYKAHKI